MPAKPGGRGMQRRAAMQIAEGGGRGLEPLADADPEAMEPVISLTG